MQTLRPWPGWLAAGVLARIVDGGVHVHDFHATLLHLLGVNHEQLTYFHQGRQFRLTDVHGEVVHALLA